MIAVLDEQDSQHAEGRINDEGISNAYIQANKHCRKQAIQLGMYDEEETKRLERGLSSLTILHFGKKTTRQKAEQQQKKQPNNKEKETKQKEAKEKETGKGRLQRLFKRRSSAK